MFTPAVFTLAPRSTPLRLVTGAWLALAVLGFGWSLPATKAAAQSAAPVVVAQAGSGPGWAELSPAQQNALRPLAGNWDNLPAGQKRKWLKMSDNLGSAAPTEQAKAQERMGQWQSLTPQQRAQARLNFAETREITDGLTPEQRQAQWQAYQLLSPEEKRKLAANARGLPPGAALAPRPSQQPLRVQPAPEFGTGIALDKLQANPVPTRRIAPLPQRQAVGQQ